ncbi:LPXTG-motif cell wall anchor domain-containing protein, partial [Ruaniaceae bacterium KH17]
TQFDCTGTLPALPNGATHSDTATVTAVGIDSRTPVDDEDEWGGRVPAPSIDIEKWNVETEGVGPEYDESGALTNDGYDGDFDAPRGKAMGVGENLLINFTISNDGNEVLEDIVVSDELTDGSGVIEDLYCVFPDGSTGTEWAGPFEIAVQFDCTGMLPALGEGERHSDLAKVTGVGVDSRTEVDDEDSWNAYVPGPSIDIEKWNDEGEAPEYDETGLLLNDGFAGDFDDDSKELVAGTETTLRFTVSNDGEEALIDVAVSDELTDGVGTITDLVCVFPDGSTGTSWDGPFDVGTQFECAGTLPALNAGESHADLAKVTGVGITSGIAVGDEDEWSAAVPPAEVATEGPNEEGTDAPEGSTPNTGVEGSALLMALASVLLLGGGGALLYARRKRVDA